MDDELRGWKAIADYFGTSDRTVQRWERDLALPVRRRGNAKGSAVVASRLELDEWRSSPAGRQAEGEQVQDVAPPPAPRKSDPPADARERGAGDDRAAPARPPRRLGRVAWLRPSWGVLALLGVLLVIAASWFGTRSVWRPGAPVADHPFASHAAAPDVQQAGAAAVAVLKLTAASGEVWSVRVIDGAMATWESAVGRALGLSVAIKGDHLRVTLSDIRSTDDGTGPPSSPRVLTLVQGAAAPIAHAGTQMTLEWTGTEGRSANAPARSNVVPPRCCVALIVRCAVGLGNDSNRQANRQPIVKVIALIVNRASTSALPDESPDNRPTAGWNHPIRRVSWRESEVDCFQRYL